MLRAGLSASVCLAALLGGAGGAWAQDAALTATTASTDAGPATTGALPLRGTLPTDLGTTGNTSARGTAATGLDTFSGDLDAAGDDLLTPATPAAAPVTNAAATTIVPETGIPARRRSVDREAADDAFAPVGVRVGTFTLRPAIEVGVTASDNPDGGPDKNPALGAVIAPEATLQSNWSRHSLQIDAKGSDTQFKDKSLDEREADVDVKGRIDVSHDTKVNLGASYHYGLQSYTSPDTPSGATERPAVHTLTGQAGVDQTLGRFGIEAAGSVQREIHEDVSLADGSKADLAREDNNAYEGRLRGSYEISPALKPYVEVAVGTRSYDRATDEDGYRRSSVWGDLRGGIIADFGPKLSGELAAGYHHEHFDDDRLADIDAPTASAAILWSPRRLTIVKLGLSTEFRPTTLEGSSESIVYGGTLSVVRSIRHDLNVEAGIGYSEEHFEGVDRTDRTFTGYATVAYNLNRDVALIGRYEYENTRSDEPSSTGDSNTVTVRVRLQR
ncbi:hypothetical protein SAMN05216548_11845 [Faunimonas pinastri]|uniref:Outer membrane beta-barrel protein n=1 Tax=Faunimonas pinastri TaxID=1855383 RepID=A0A1H9P368_9HYPH|nr:outer membrane beta-barrel protein [Faunimonas pinastri]SER42724.1 hypothetical protein SAMN05216548_11845 [Faunimonas pinastri]